MQLNSYCNDYDLEGFWGPDESFNLLAWLPLFSFPFFYRKQTKLRFLLLNSHCKNGHLGGFSGPKGVFRCLAWLPLFSRFCFGREKQQIHPAFCRGILIIKVVICKVAAPIEICWFLAWLPVISLSFFRKNKNYTPISALEFLW